MKQELRIRFRALRDAVPVPRRQEVASIVAATLRRLPEYVAARGLLLYASFGSEVPTGPLLAAASEDGKPVAFPRIDGKALSLHEWRPEAALVPNRVGVPQPPPEAPPFDVGAVDLVVVPGLAFDRRGSRLGYGGGYYDRLLKTAPRAFRVGLAYDLQLVPSLPSTHLDVPMDCLVTEAGVHRLPHRKH